MADSRLTEVESRLGHLKSERSPLEGHWRELARLARPFREQVMSGGRSPGKKVGGDLFDGTAGYAATNLAAGLWGMGTNSAADWFSIASVHDELNQVREVQQWCATVTRLLRTAFAANGGGFYAAAMTYFLDVVTFGTAIMYSDEDVGGGGLWHAAIPLHECYIGEDARRRVDTLYRTPTFTTRQAAKEFGEDALHPAMRRVLDREPDRRWPFLHAVEPNPDANPRKLQARFLPVRSLYIDLENRHIIRVGGYQELPYSVMRWWQEAGEVYGEGPAALARADAKTVNTMAKTTIVAAQKVVDPPLMASDELAARGIRTAPGSIIPGTLNPLTGEPLLRPLQTNAQIGIGLEMEEQRRDAIREAFYWSLLVMKPMSRATATEVLARQEEQLRLMGPHLGRMNTEFLDPTVTRAFAIMQRAGALPPPPAVVLKAPALKVAYVSPLARAQKVAEAGAVVRFLEAAGPLVQVKPEALDVVNADAAVRALADGFNVPAALVEDPRTVAAIRQQRADQVAQQQQLANAQAGASVARDLGTAAAAAGALE